MAQGYLPLFRHPVKLHPNGPALHMPVFAGEHVEQSATKFLAAAGVPADALPDFAAALAAEVKLELVGKGLAPLTSFKFATAAGASVCLPASPLCFLAVALFQLSFAGLSARAPPALVNPSESPTQETCHVGVLRHSHCQFTASEASLCFPGVALFLELRSSAACTQC